MPALGRRDQRSEAAKEYRKWYNTKRWRDTRSHQLATHPLCAMCLAAGRTTAATVCDHIDPKSKETYEGFFAGPFQSLCDAEPYRCHSSTKQQAERLGYSPATDMDGYPIDPMHPSNRAAR